MRRSVKIFCALLAGGLALAALGAAAVAQRFDAEAVRARLIAQVETATGRALSVEALRITLLPRPIAHLQGLRLANAPGFGPEPFARVDHADIRLRLLPWLLHRDLQIDRIALHAPQLHLQREADGRDNWRDLLSAPGAAPAASSAATSDAGRSGARFAVAAVQIDDGRLQLRDARRGFDGSLEGLSLSAANLQRGQPFDLQLGFTSEALGRSAPIEAEIRTRLSLDPQRALLSTEAFRLSLHGLDPALQAAIEVTAQLRLDFEAQQFAAEKLQAAIRLDAAQLPAAFRESRLEADVLYETDPASLRIASAEWRLAGLSVNFAIDGSALDQPQPRFTGPLIVKPFKPRELLAQIGLEVLTRDAAALKEMSLRARIEAGAESASLRDLVLKLDQSTLSGSIELPSYAPLAAQFALKLDALDADRYRRPQADPDDPAEGLVAAGDPLPFDQLDHLSAAGVLDIGKLSVGGLRLAALKLRVDAPQGQDKRLITTAALYGGSLNSSTHVQRGETPRLRQSLQLAGVDLAALLAALGQPPQLSGRADLQLDLAGRGHSRDALEQSLAGELALDVADGSLRGLNLAEVLRHALAQLRGQDFAETETQETTFTRLLVKGHVDARQLRAEDVVLRSPLYRAEGSGRLAFATQTLDAALRLSLVEAPSSAGEEPLAELAGLSLPLRLSGPWDAPQCTFDLRAALSPKLLERLHERSPGRLMPMPERRSGEASLRERLLQELEQRLDAARRPAPSPAPSPGPSPAPAPANGIL